MSYLTGTQHGTSDLTADQDWYATIQGGGGGFRQDDGSSSSGVNNEWFSQTNARPDDPFDACVTTDGYPALDTQYQSWMQDDVPQTADCSPFPTGGEWVDARPNLSPGVYQPSFVPFHPQQGSVGGVALSGLPPIPFAPPEDSMGMALPTAHGGEGARPRPQGGSSEPGSPPRQAAM